MQGSSPSGDAFYLDINDGSKLAKVFVELSDVVEIPRDLPHFQLGVHIMITLGKPALILVVEASPKKDEGICVIFNTLSRREASFKKRDRICKEMRRKVEQLPNGSERY